LIKSLKAQLASVQAQLAQSGGASSAGSAPASGAGQHGTAATAGDSTQSTADQSRASQQAARTTSLQNEATTISSAIDVATGELAQLMLASGTTTGMISTQA
jgi:hypothetical protein